MAENLIVYQGAKEDQYKNLIPQIKALVMQETDITANLANICAALKEQFNWFWVGFYLVQKEELVVGPFQGPIACTRIKKGRGVCGKSWEQGKTIIVEDVRTFPTHIACNSLSKSEIVVPLFKNEEVVAVLDVDSDQYSTFDLIDQKYLEQVARLVFDAGSHKEQ